jgi:hypothetical protein
MSPVGQDKPTPELVGEDIVIGVATSSADGDAPTKLNKPNCSLGRSLIGLVRLKES